MNDLFGYPVIESDEFPKCETGDLIIGPPTETIRLKRRSRIECILYSPKLFVQLYQIARKYNNRIASVIWAWQGTIALFEI